MSKGTQPRKRPAFRREGSGPSWRAGEEGGVELGREGGREGGREV